jgi:hypothetical protein
VGRRTAAVVRTAACRSRRPAAPPALRLCRICDSRRATARVFLLQILAPDSSRAIHVIHLRGALHPRGFRCTPGNWRNAASMIPWSACRRGLLLRGGQRRPRKCYRLNGSPFLRDVRCRRWRDAGGQRLRSGSHRCVEGVTCNLRRRCVCSKITLVKAYEDAAGGFPRAPAPG